MLVLKTKSIDEEGREWVEVFEAERIAHSETRNDDHTFEPLTDLVIGKLSGSSSKQPFILSHVRLFSPTGTLKNDIAILPMTQCWIMENGKTVDSFISRYICTEHDELNKIPHC